MNLRTITHEDVTQLREIASEQGWDEIAYDCRTELQQRIADRELDHD